MKIISLVGLTTLSIATIAAVSIPTVASAESTNYLGLGASNSGVAIGSKFTVNDNFSLRPTAIGEVDRGDLEGQVFVPITYDFKPTFGGVMPYIGVGGGYTTDDDGNFGGVVTGGIDYRINKNLTANGSVNLGIFDENEVHAVVGISTNF